MGLSWQRGLGNGPVGHFLSPERLLERLLFAEPLRRRMRVLFTDVWIADSEDVVLLHEPGHYPVAFFPWLTSAPACSSRSSAPVTASSATPPGTPSS
jgi:hypothetical protein